MGRAAKKTEAGSSGRLATARRGAWNAAAHKKPPRGKQLRTPSPVARAFKLLMLLSMMAALGFSVVLIADLTLSAIGGMRFGQITFAELIDKVQDRIFDRDVPQPKPKPAPKKLLPAPAAEPSRAPRPAPRPDDYVRHVEPRPDPEIEAARKRLEELLQRL